MAALLPGPRPSVRRVIRRAGELLAPSGGYARRLERALLTVLVGRPINLQPAAVGLFIGSGTLEAAHRTVLQVRMKRSGQRWAYHSCDNMLRLRVAYKSGKFGLVTNLLRNPPAKF